MDDGLPLCVRQVFAGTLHDIDRLHRRVAELEQHTTEQHLQLSAREDEFDAAQAANRELMTNLTGHPPAGVNTWTTPVAQVRVAPRSA